MVVVVGVTTTVAPVKEPGIHVYVEAPLAVKVAELPEQSAVGLETAVTVGYVFTKIDTVAFEVQIPFEPVTV